MGNRRSGPPGVQFQLPPLRPGVRNFLIALAALYIVELVVANFVLGNPGDLYRWLAWSPTPTEPLWNQAWQPVTKYLVQGNNPIQVFFSLIVLYFFLPWTLDRFVPRHLSQMVLSVVLGCFLAGLLWTGFAWSAVLIGVPAGTGWLGGTAMGYEPFVLALVAVFSLAQPERDINLMFVLPLKAKWVLWLSVGFAAFSFLASPGVHTFELFGAVGGVVAWWQWLGPGGTRRKYKNTGKKIEKELKFQVFDGGRQGEQDGGDEWVN